MTTVTGSGTGTIDRVQSYPSNLALLTLIPKPQPGSIFTGWKGACTGTDPCVIYIGNPISVVATFERPAVNGLCGKTNNICITGKSSDKTDSPTQYLWSCNGINGGTNASCVVNKPVYTVSYNANKATSGVVP